MATTKGAPRTSRIKERATTGDKITTFRVTTRAGHELRFFYNPDRDLLVVDLNHKERAGGNEIVRRTLDEKALLAHCAKLPKWEDA